MKRATRVLWVWIPILAISAGGANDVLRSTRVHGVVHDSRIVVTLTERRLKVVRGDEVVGEYEIAVGKPETPTPTGEFRLSVKRLHPGPPAGVFGTRWMEFYRVTTRDGALRLYGIHGTNAPQRIGLAVSHGCIRLRNHDVEEIYLEAYIGEPVEIIGSVAAGPVQ
jgi:lipoprotein-anchoring transpeptidase ErfK/SrfK